MRLSVIHILYINKNDNRFLRVKKSYEKVENKNKKWKMITTLILPAVGFTTIVVFVIAIVIMKKLNHEATTELPQEINESLL